VLPFAATFDAKHLQRFHNEAQAAAQLHHTNIVPVYAVGCERGIHYYAMQLIEGQSLAAVVQQMRGQDLGTPQTANPNAAASCAGWKPEARTATAVGTGNRTQATMNQRPIWVQRSTLTIDVSLGRPTMSGK